MNAQRMITAVCLASGLLGFTAMPSSAQHSSGGTSPGVTEGQQGQTGSKSQGVPGSGFNPMTAPVAPSQVADRDQKGARAAARASALYPAAHQGPMTVIRAPAIIRIPVTARGQAVPIRARDQAGAEADGRLLVSSQCPLPVLVRRGGSARNPLATKFSPSLVSDPMPADTVRCYSCRTIE